MFLGGHKNRRRLYLQIYLYFVRKASVSVRKVINLGRQESCELIKAGRNYAGVVAAMNSEIHHHADCFCLEAVGQKWVKSTANLCLSMPSKHFYRFVRRSPERLKIRPVRLFCVSTPTQSECDLSELFAPELCQALFNVSSVFSNRP